MSDVIDIKTKKKKLTPEEACRREEYLRDHAVEILRELLWSWRRPEPAGQ